MGFHHLKSLTQLYLSPRVLSIAFFAFPYGMTFFLVVTIPQVWLKEVGINNTQIGLFALVSLPYVLKFLWAPLVDIIKIPFLHRLGQRRSWLILIHSILIIGFFLLAYSRPSVQNLLYISSIAFFLAIVCATQDIIVDAYRIEILDKDQSIPGVSMLIFGYRMGSTVAKAGSLYLAHYFNWTVAYGVMATLIVVGIIATLLNPEPAHSVYPRTFQGTVIEPFWEMIHRSSYWGIVCVFVVCYRLGDAMINNMAMPFYLELGFSKNHIASIMNVFGVGATIAGGFIGAYVVRKLHVFNALWLCGIIHTLSNFMFLVLINMGPHIPLLYMAIGVENTTAGMSTAAFFVYLSRLCSLKYAATQFALLTSLWSLATPLASCSGWIVDRFQKGWSEFFLLTIIVSFGSLIFIRWLPRYRFGNDGALPTQ